MSLDDAEREHLRERFREYQETGDRAIRDELIEAHLRLAEHLARRFNNRGVPLEDLVQVASLGLVKAVERFEPERGLEFSTFATPTIVGELKRHFRDKGWSVRVPRRIQELHVEVNSLVGTLTQRLGRSPTIAELALASGTSEEEVLEAMEAAQAYRSTSIDAPSGGEDSGLGLAGQLGDEDTNLFAAENRMLVATLVDTLPKREQLIMKLRFYDGMTQSQIADRLGISQMHVSRLLARSLGQLRARLEHEGWRRDPGPDRPARPRPAAAVLRPSRRRRRRPAGPGGRAHPRRGRAGPGPDGGGDRPAGGSRRVRPAPQRPRPPPRRHRPQHARARRLRLPRRAQGDPRQHRPRHRLPGHPGRPHRPAGDPAGRGGALRRGRRPAGAPAGVAGGFGSTGR